MHLITCTCTHAISNLKLVEGRFAILLAQLSGISQTLRNVVGPTNILAPLTDALIFRETSILLGTALLYQDKLPGDQDFRG